MPANTKPSITPTPNGPYRESDLEILRDRHGAIETRPTMYLCRCGGSRNKPLCDGTHWHIGFTDEQR